MTECVCLSENTYREVKAVFLCVCARVVVCGGVFGRIPGSGNSGPS